jgi:hypothetical protein
MPKTIKTQRRATPQEIRDFLSAYDPRVQTLTRKVRALVLKVIPTAVEQIDLPAKLLGYSFAHTYQNTVCVIMPLKSAVNLGFPRGIELPDPAGLLAGTGKRARHVKLTEVAQVETPAVRALLEAALAITPR